MSAVREYQGGFVLDDVRFGLRPAYRYIRATDDLPTYGGLDSDPLCKVKLFHPESEYRYYVAALTIYDGMPVLTGYVTGLFEDEFGDTALEEIAAIRGRMFGLPVERDLCWEPRRLSELMAVTA